jgi:hypothetical protein
MGGVTDVGFSLIRMLHDLMAFQMCPVFVYMVGENMLSCNLEAE